MNISSSFDSIELALGGSPFLLTLGFILIAGISILIYRYTVPRIGGVLKIFLITLRVLALVSILALILEPVITINYKKETKPVDFLFVDNSKSIVYKDSAENSSRIKKISKEFLQKNESRAELYTFGSSVKKINPDDLENLTFSEFNTNFSQLFNFLDNSDEYISSVTILSDGIITEGADPLYEGAKNNYPIYTIGVGDTTVERDAEIKKVLNNEYIYVNQTTQISVTILSFGYAGQSAPISLYANNLLIEQKSLTFDLSGINVVNFSYKPEIAGQIKLTMRLGSLKDERTYSNNVRNFFVDVLSNKLKIALMAGRPSNDVSFVYNTLAENENLEVRRFIQISKTQNYPVKSSLEMLDSADILFLMDFPGQNTSEEILNRVRKAIVEENKPFFISVSEGTDLRRLAGLQNELPFIISRILPGISEIQVVIEDINHPFFKYGNADNISHWNNFPPVSRNNSVFDSKPESDVLAKIKIKNLPLESPLILTRAVGSTRSIALLAGDYWRWKLLNANKNFRHFDNFFSAVVKWLRIDSKNKTVNIKSLKKIYGLGEQIEFTAEIYDETFNPVDNADVSLIVKNENNSYNITMSSVGRGFYEGILESGSAGDYYFTGNANIGNKKLGEDKGRFSIQDIDNESLVTTMNKTLLSQLAEFSGGSYIYRGGENGLTDLPGRDKLSEPKIELSASEIQLRNNEWPLIFIILFFAVEWLLRKRNGML